ncbi:MAG TPA: DnaA regulatory inactivator Hda [Gammaproteobacteria bacterium]|nr:DnaA regulatory inactivator Hda [Gammaproteobacteria bacterium]
MGQLPLALALADHARFETFVGGSNAAAVRHARALADGEPGIVWVSGPAASGKTHLLQAACRNAAQAGRRAMYLALLDEHAAEPAILSGLDGLDLLALDHVEVVARDAAWERQLFLLFNEIAAKPGGLLLASRAPAVASGFELRDLASRAAGAIAYRLQPLVHGERVDALLVHARARGLELERGAAEYLLDRVDRDMATLGRWLDRLDRESLVEQRRITIPFIRARLSADPT